MARGGVNNLIKWEVIIPINTYWYLRVTVFWYPCGNYISLEKRTFNPRSLVVKLAPTASNTNLPKHTPQHFFTR